MRRPYVGTAPVTRQFGVYDPAYANYPGSKHPGTDYGLSYRQVQVAAISGTAKIYARGNTSTGRGNEVVITSGTTETKHCHLDFILVSDGQQVTAGEPIGNTGYTGYVLPKSKEGSHLHFEVLQNGVYVDPETQYNKEVPVIIQNVPNWFGRCMKVMQRERGRDLGKVEFEKYAVGAEFLHWVEAVQDNKESDDYYALGQWAKANKAPTEAKIVELGKAVTIKDSEIKKLQAQLAVQSEDTELLNGFGLWLTKLVARLGLRKDT